MSTLKVDGIRSNSASSDAITLASDGTCTANITNRSNRNLIINGAMQVAQRGTSSTSYGYATVDRWRNTQSGVTVTPTQSQQTATSSDTGIWEAGFRHYLRFALPSAGTNSAASWISFTQFIEAQDIASSGWNYTSTSSYITVSFWIRVSTNQTFYANVGTRDGTRKRFSFAITASGNNTWTKITKTIPGHADLQFDDNTDRGLDVQITPHYGTDYTGTATLDSWVNNSGTNAYPDYATTWLTAGASTFDLTGVQVEVSDHATDFEHRSYAQELHLCKRYYVELGRATSGESNQVMNGLQAYSTSALFGVLAQLPVTMRTKPTCTVVGQVKFSDKAGGNAQTPSSTLAVNHTSINYIGTSGVSFGSAHFIQGGFAVCLTSNDGNNYVKVDAEL